MTPLATWKEGEGGGEGKKKRRRQANSLANSGTRVEKIMGNDRSTKNMRSRGRKTSTPNTQRRFCKETEARVKRNEGKVT